MKKLGKFLRVSLALCASVVMTISATACGSDSKKNELVYVHPWTSEGLEGHFFSGANMGPVSWFVVEGFGDFLRTQDSVYYTTAKSIEHSPDHTSTVTLRNDVYWQHTNQKFTAQDVVAFYYLNTGSITNYLFDIEATDETHVKFTWNPAVEPADEVKTLLLVTDRVATVPYTVFKEFADKCINIYKKAKRADDFKTMPKYGRVISEEEGAILSDTYSKYQDFTPEFFPATGPYEINTYDANEMILSKNQTWYNKDKVGFETIKLINSVGDSSLFSSMLIKGSIDLWLNTPSKPVAENIIKSNKNIAFYKVHSPYSQGVKFNMQKQDFWTEDVRQAFQYLFDRDEIRRSSSFYSTTSWTSVSGMNDSDILKWMSDAGKKEMSQKYTYSFDLNRAEEILTAAGWKKKAGKWYDSKNQLVKLIIGYDGSNTVPSSVAEAVQAQLTNFGITASLKRAASYAEFYAAATESKSAYDMVCDNTAYNASYNYPSAAFTEVYYSGVGATGNLKFYKDETLLGLNNQEFKPADYIDKMLTLTGKDLQTATDNLVIGLARENVGVNIYQESSGGFYNMKKIDGLPFPKEISKNRDIQYVPGDGSEDQIKLLYTMLFYDHGSALYNGMLFPKK